MKQLFAFLVMLLSASVLYAQDIITLKNGETINGKVSEIGVSEIRYYKSDNPDGPVYVTNKFDVAQVVYANGNKDVFKTQASAPVTQSRGNTRNRRRNYYTPYVYPLLIPHIDLGHHGFFGEHHGGGHHGGHH